MQIPHIYPRDPEQENRAAVVKIPPAFLYELLRRVPLLETQRHWNKTGTLRPDCRIEMVGVGQDGSFEMLIVGEQFPQFVAGAIPWALPLVGTDSFLDALDRLADERRSETPLMFHSDCGGTLVLVGPVPVGPGEVNLWRCDECGREIDDTDYEAFQQTPEADE